MTGPPVAVIEGVRRGGGGTGSGVLQFTVSDNGTLAYIPGAVPPLTRRQHFVYDMSGTASPRRLNFGGRDVSPAWTAVALRTG